MLLVYAMFRGIKFLLRRNKKADTLFIVNICNHVAAYTTQMRELTMRTITLSAAAILAFAAFSMPAHAEYNTGAQAQNGQCWKDSAGRKGDFGYWAPCAEKASATAATPAVHHTAKHKKTSN